MMRSVRIAISMAFVGLLASQAWTAEPDKTTELEGTWELVFFERDGKEVKIQKDTKLVVGTSSS